MDKWKLHLLKAAVWLLILQGISSLLEFSDVAIFGESQRSAVDALATVFMTEWLCNRIWRNERQ